MFAVILVSAFLLPLLYMVTTVVPAARSQIATPGAPLWPAAPETGTYEGAEYPIYAVPIDGATRNLMLIETGRESSVFVDPADPSATKIEWQGRWRTLEQAWRFAPNSSRTSRRSGTSSTSRDCCATRSAIAVLSTIGAVALVDPGGVRLRPVPVPRPEHALLHPARHDHPAASR